jgi:hypothetical protein
MVIKRTPNGTEYEEPPYTAEGRVLPPHERRPGHCGEAGADNCAAAKTEAARQVAPFFSAAANVVDRVSPR